MTLVLSVHGRDTLWMVVDRQLSFRGQPLKDDAVKVANLETTDGVALLGYAGLGATARGTEPSEWMNAVLRGRGGLTLEQALGFLSVAARRELPKHITRIPGHAHDIIIPSFIKDVGARLYTIGNVIDPKTGEHTYRYTRLESGYPGSPPPRIGAGGTGGLYLDSDRGWTRPLLSLVKKHDSGKASDDLMADHLAALNYEVHRQVPRTVGERCIVIWRRRRDPRREGPGGGHRFYTGLDRERDSGAIPTIVNGMDVRSIAEVLMQQIEEAGGLLKQPEIDADETNRRLKQLPHEPDEKLR